MFKDKLCKIHKSTHVYDEDNDMYRKKYKMDLKTRLKDSKRKYHNTERALISILKYLFGKREVLENIYPMWARSHKGVLFEYDMAVIGKRIIIEFNGIQHYKYPNFFHKTLKEFQEQKKRDRIKIRLAKENGWKLITIKYNEFISIDLVKRKLNGIK